MQTQVTTDYVEIKLTGKPFVDKSHWKDQNYVPENIYTGTVVDAPPGSDYRTGQTILFAKVFRLVVDQTEEKHFVHKNAIIATAV